MNKAGPRRTVIVVFDMNLKPVGVYLNTVHVKDALGVDPGNLDKHFKGQILCPTGRDGEVYFIVKHDVGVSCLCIEDIFRDSLVQAQRSKMEAIVSKLNLQTVRAIDDEKLKQIEQILKS